MIESARAVIVEIEVSTDAEGQRLDRFLADLAAAGVETELPPLSRARIQKLVNAGLVTIAGRPVRASLSLRGAELITVIIPAPAAVELEPEPMSLDILYEDRDVVALNKPAGLVVHPGAGQSRGTLVHGLLAHCRDLSGVGGELRPGIVHRLDRGTSGVMIVAKNDLAHRALAEQFAGRAVRKSYIAFVLGRPDEEQAVIDTWYGRHPRDRKRFSSRVRPSGYRRRAITTFSLQAAGGGLAKLAVTIETGRTHQIRVHLSEHGHPVVGDPLYGGQRLNRMPRGPVRDLAALLEHQALHAATLEIAHPTRGTLLGLEAPLPPKLQALSTAMAAVDAHGR